ncbi:MAG TPA: hypothetical protein VMB72_10700 [Acidimicrobiales bacterium]|nr:hypothetical protein [Acidimicrobiales bacterium]
MTLTEDAPVATPAPSPAGELPGIVRRRLAVLVVVGLVLGVLGLVVLATRPAHKPSAASVRNVPVSISCSAAGTCAAVDDQGNAVRLVGGTWRRPTPLGVPAMTAVSCAGPGFCAATSITGSVSVLRDGHWSARRKIDPRASGLLDLFGMSGVSAVSCPTDAFCMAGDVQGPVLCRRIRLYRAASEQTGTANK